jgi:hypothetical protein
MPEIKEEYLLRAIKVLLFLVKGFFGFMLVMLTLPFLLIR